MGAGTPDEQSDVTEVSGVKPGSEVRASTKTDARHGRPHRDKSRAA